jgi:UDP-2,4-diacetamido-2,4,6-trideoxy-beta-L-altropyranose hydrolase
MRIVFRVDASIQMGTGHTMRCLALAQALKDNGDSVEFICRKHEGNLISKIHSNGFNVLELNLPKEDKIDNKLSHSHWLGVTQQRDAIDCINALQSSKIDWLIVDHYGIDEDWEQQLKRYCRKLMVIDDLADRKHLCDILLDQTYGREQQDYKKLLPKSCILLLGSQYALLRSEFLKWRKYSLNHRSNTEFRKILINMGGVDIDNITSKLLEELEGCCLSNNIEVIIIMGDTSPHIDSVRVKANESPYKVEVKTNVDNMAEIMSSADFAIGAAGATTWERCCLGLPTIQMIVANNQTLIANKLHLINAIEFMENMSNLSSHINNIFKYYKKMSLVSSSIVDGKGVERVVKCISSSVDNYTNALIIRPAESIDSNFVYSLQTKESRRYFINTDVPVMDEHTNWFDRVMSSHNSQLFILISNNYKSGILKLSNLNENMVDISIIISTNFRGSGIAKNAIKVIDNLMPDKNLKAVIHNQNIASRKVFIKSDFVLNNKTGDFSEYIKSRV